jgi:DNA-directed RNA polymerase subunit H (RpoH/RPB5)
MSATNTISIYNSRKTLLDIFGEKRDLFENVGDYENFNINEVEAMIKNDQLDMLFTRNSKNPVSHSVYVKYMITKSSSRIQAIQDLVEELFELEGVLTKNDTLVVIVNDEPNDSLIAKLCHLYDTLGIFVVVHNIKRLQRNILKHSLVPKHSVVHDIVLEDSAISELEKVKQKYNLKSLSQLPEISRFDPVALLIELRPGQICKIERSSITSVDSEYYRVCV